MAILIDAEPVIKRLTSVCLTDDCFGLGIQMGINRAMEILGEAKIVDAVEVVRCKDCKHCYKATFSSTGYRCKVWGVYDKDCEVTPEHYCSYGERKDND